MGIAYCHMLSEVLQTHTELTLTLPDAADMPELGDLRGKRVLYPVVYALHGGAEDCTMWLRKTRVEEYGQRYGFMTVSINGFSSAYSDMLHGYRVFTFLTEELPRFIEATFPASPAWQDRFVAGFSMGGQGALKAAFRCPEKYAACLPLCGARDIVSLFEKWERMENGPDLTAARDALGPIGKLRGSENDLVHLAREAAKRPGRRPRLFVACAQGDYAAALTEEYHGLLLELGIEHEYYTAPGAHDYDFVDGALLWALERWLALRGPRVEDDAR